ncbi:sensor histidine kinase [Carboxylicivirga sp. RSCT41]|uniref:sensor histidine kinase n=1 Tax=Carboxylicivirga agarovorans TaxID=3417570 RepID=UPI003D3463E0
MWRKRLFSSVKKNLFVSASVYEVQDLVLIHMLHITFTLTFVSAITNPFLNLPKSVVYGNFIAMFFVTLVYWLVRFRSQFVLGRRLYLAFVFIMINFLWFETGGSTGPTLFSILALIPMFTFMIDNRYLKFGYLIIGINVPLLLLAEGYKPELVTYYTSNMQRILDILVVCSVFVFFEIPLIIYVKNTVIKQRNSAQQSALVKTSYITNLSHEIRTPMNAILGFSELLNIGELDKDEQSSYIKHINENGNTLLLLLNNIINISKIEQEQTRISISRFSTLEVLRRVHSSFSYKQSSVLDFKILTDEQDDIIIYSDVVLLYQILSNLTFNALKFTKEGYVHLDIKANDDSLLFIVRDTGTGICESKQASIFKQFEQAKGDNHLINLNGSGLGLAICSNLTEKLKGELCFESEKNAGTTFYLKLPIKF